MNVADYVVTHEEIKPQRHKEHREKKEDIHEYSILRTTGLLIAARIISFSPCPLCLCGLTLKQL